MKLCVACLELGHYRIILESYELIEVSSGGMVDVRE